MPYIASETLPKAAPTSSTTLPKATPTSNTTTDNSFLIVGIVALGVVLALAFTCVMWMRMRSPTKPTQTGGYARCDGHTY
jgi:uncharacterized protein HemX